jgi:shikimate dehydrogenase
MAAIELGLVGCGIARSQAPRLHEVAASICGLDLTYTLFDLGENESVPFEQMIRELADRGLRGVNVTHPFKERAAAMVDIPDAGTRNLGAVNTIRFSDSTGHNTDYSGFIKAYRTSFGAAAPGSVLMVGAGGVGRAVAFALATIDSDVKLRIVDIDEAKAQGLASELQALKVDCTAHATDELEALADVDGLVNCTPLGMYQYPGTALPDPLVGGQRWAFDAVYTPIDTPFLERARTQGLEVLTGYELFFYQGIDAFEIFTGTVPDPQALRDRLTRS